MNSKKETFYILNEKIVRENEGITHTKRNKKILWYCEDIAVFEHSDISDIICQSCLGVICDGAMVIDKITGEQITFSGEDTEEFESWKKTLTLEKLIDIVIEVYFTFNNAKTTKEYYFEKKEMVRPTEKRRAKLFHLMVLNRETEKIIEEIDYSDFNEIINHFKQYIKPDKQAIEKYIFILNDIDLTDCFKDGDDKNYITAESEYDECSFSIIE